MKYLAIDLGAGSGRAIVGEVADGKLELREVLRFANEPVVENGVMRWDFAALMGNIRRGIELAGPVDGIGVDTWGVDFGLVRGGGLVVSPVCYRDERTKGFLSSADRFVSRAEMYASTGIQQMEINTLYQLLAAPAAPDTRLLFVPDLVNFELTGVLKNEYTIASTSQLLDARRRAWDVALMGKLGIPSQIFGQISMPGDVVGTLKNGTRVFAVGSHDTASAIGAIAAESDKNWAFLSSGTWSLMGVTLTEPVLTEEARKAEFTNEGGVDGRILFMRNITGLWILQRLMKEWETDDYERILGEAAVCSDFFSRIDVADECFTRQGLMWLEITNYCKRTAQPEPKSRGEMVRCVLESLSAKYEVVKRRIEQLTGREIERLYVVGGGSKNGLLNQLIANALGIEVVVGLAEGTAIGNIMQQAIADGVVSSWTQAHDIIRSSFPPTSYFPE